MPVNALAIRLSQAEQPFKPLFSPYQLGPRWVLIQPVGSTPVTPEGSCAAAVKALPARQPDQEGRTS
jgi:hypothetical protein